VRRILTSMFASGLFDTTQTGTIGATVTSAAQSGGSHAHRRGRQRAAQEQRPVLPIGASTSSIAVIGDDAGNNVMTGGRRQRTRQPVHARLRRTPLQGIRARAGSGVNVSYARASPRRAATSSTPRPHPGLGRRHRPDRGSNFTNTGLSGTPAVTRTDPNVNFLWGGQPPASGVPATGWSVRWTGRLTPPTTGTYQFSLNSDDGSRLFVNGQQVINNWFNQPPTTRTGSIALTAGAAGDHRGRLLPGRRRQPGQPRLADPQPGPATARRWRRRGAQLAVVFRVQTPRARAAT